MTKSKQSSIETLLLNRYRHVADSVAALFFPYAEVVIHNLITQKILYLANNLSNRQVGDNCSLEEIESTKKQKMVGPYEKLNWDGRKMRSTSAILFDDVGNAIGMICTNFNIAVFEDMQSMLGVFINGIGVQPQPTELFNDYWQEQINTYLHQWLQEHQVGLNTLTRAHRREVVLALYQHGAFRRKNAVNYIANILGTARATIYKYIKEIKESEMRSMRGD